MSNHLSSDFQVVDEFSNAVARSGVVITEPVIADGVFRRVHAEGDKKGKKDAFYVLHSDGLPSGFFGHWGRNISEKWCAKSENTLTPIEREELQKRIAESKKQREFELAKLRETAAKKAAVMWGKARKIDTSSGHFYTHEKGVLPYGVRVLRGMLLVPVRNPNGELVGLQLIRKNENNETIKQFLTGTPTAGNYCSLGKPEGDSPTIAIGEGWATMATVYMAAQYKWPCVVAFFANNLTPVAKTIRSKFPRAKLILIADNDSATEQRTGINPGVTEARKAALAVNGFLIAPNFNGVSA